MSSVDIYTKNNPGFSKLTVESTGELMKNREAASVLDATHRIDVAQDKDGNPIIFSIGDNGEFYVVYRDTGTPTGWNRVDLSALLGGALQVTAFGMYQNGDKKIMLAIGACATGKTGDCTVYITPCLDNNPLLWSDAAAVGWKKRPFIKGSIGVNEFRIGGDHSASGKIPLAIVAVTRAGNVEHWQLNSEYSNDTWSMQEFLLPENAVGHMLDMAIGEIEGRQGVYALYSTSTGKSVEFTSLPFKVPHVNKTQRLNYTFDLPGDVNQIEVLPTTGNSYDLYGAGDGLHRWVGSSRTSSPIAANVRPVSKLVARQDSDHIAIWMVQGDENLKYVRGQRGDNPNWSIPATLGTKVTQIAALRNDVRKTNEVFTVKGDNSLSYYYQDPSTTLWNKTRIPVPAVQGSIEFDSYTTHLQLYEEGDVPLMNKEFKLTASAWCYVTVNHTLHVVSPESLATIKPDETGAITIINRVYSVSTPIFHLTADWLDGIVDINPAAIAYAKLDAVKSGDDLRNVKLSDGSSLLPAGTKKEDADAVGQAIGKLNEVKGSLPAGGTGSPRSVGTKALTQVQPNASVGSFGVTFTGTSHQFVEGSAARSMLDVGEAIEGVAGDILSWMEHAVEDVVHFVVNVAEGIAEFVVKIGEELVKFVVDTAEAVYRAVSWLFKKIGVFFEDLIKWLGFLFDWGDIKRTHTALKNMFNEGLQFLTDEITDGEKKVKVFFDDVKERIVGKTLADQLGDKATVPISGIGQKNSESKFRSDPKTNYVNYHLKSPAARQDDGSDSPFDASLLKMLEDNLVSFGEAEINTAKNAIVEIAQNIRGKSVGEAIESVLEIIVAAILQEIENGVLEVMEVAKLFLEAIGEALNAEWDIPVLSDLYKLFVGGELTLLDLCCLILAIPVTIMYKIVMDEAPFSADQTSLITGGLSPRAPRQSLGAAASSEPSAGELAASFLLGGVCVTAGRGVGGLMTIITGVVPSGILNWKWFAAKTVVSTLTYAASATNRAIATAIPKPPINPTWLSDFEGVLVYAQGAWPVMDLLSIPEGPRQGMGVLKMFCGILNTSCTAGLFAGELLSDAPSGTKVDDGFKFLENLGMGIGQITGPMIKMSEEDPEVEAVIIVINGLSGVTSVLTNFVRASVAVGEGKMFAPI